MPDMKLEDLEPPKCFNCGIAVTADYLCSGCGKYVCDDCDENLTLMGPHLADEHLERTEVEW
jgi:hypothetical protein